jgi:hypothetical protein
MSASYVRNKVRQWCAAAAASTGIPFHDTVNVSVNPTDPVWFTVAFVSESHEGTFCKPDFIENGFISVVFFALPGTGDTACITAVEAVIPVLFANLDLKLALINYDPVDEDSLGSADKDYRMSVSINYRLSL